MNTDVVLHPTRLAVEFAAMYAGGILLGSFAPDNQGVAVVGGALGIVLVRLGARYNAPARSGRHVAS